MSARRTWSILTAAASTAVLATSVPRADAALEIRHSLTARYDSELTRAYQECATPNDISAGGVPACSPPVTSACEFARGDVEMNPRSNVPGVQLDMNLRTVSGPGSCATGPYNAVFSLRVTADDPVCTGGQCTWVDVDILVPLTAHNIGSSHNFEINHVIFEDYLQSSYAVTAGHVANYEVRGVTVMGPDNLPIAAAGVGNHSANRFRSDVTARYDPSCGVPGGNTPDTTNQSGVPACSGPVWVANCDFTSGEIQMKDGSGPPSIVAAFTRVVGASSLCSTASYEIHTVLRTTASVCSGAPCTLVDTPATVTVDPVGGSIFDTVPLTAPDFGTLSESVEVRDAFVRDPLGEDLASTGVTNAFAIEDPGVRFVFRDPLNPSDDKLSLRGKFGHPSLDPSVGGATFTVTDQNGTIYAVTIPASSWLVKTPGAKWLYKDQLGTLGGVRRASITTIRQGAGLKFSLKAKDVSLGGADLPSVNLVLDASNGGSGRSIAMRNATCRSKAKSKTCRL